MAFPAGATTRNVAFSNVIDAEDGTQYSCRVLVTCNDTLVHIATGVPVVASPEFRDPPSFALMVTDQTTIWRDENGNALTTSPTHSYRLDFEYFIDNEWVPYRSISKLLVPTGAGDLDMDLISSGSTQYTDL